MLLSLRVYEGIKFTHYNFIKHNPVNELLGVRDCINIFYDFLVFFKIFTIFEDFSTTMFFYAYTLYSLFRTHMSAFPSIFRLLKNVHTFTLYYIPQKCCKFLCCFFFFITILLLLHFFFKYHIFFIYT